MTEKLKYHTSVVILAAGCGSRMSSDIPKQNMIIGSLSVVERCVAAFDRCTDIDSIVLVVRDCDVEQMAHLITNYPKITSIVPGGENRAESASFGFSAIPAEAEFVAIHDAARCLITPEMISSVLRAAYVSGAATAATRVTDTLKRVDGDGMILTTVPRENMYRAETPQAFSREIYSRALKLHDASDAVTDDNMLVEKLGIGIRCVETGGYNIKITTADDLLFAEYLLMKRGDLGE